MVWRRHPSARWSCGMLFPVGSHCRYGTPQLSAEGLRGKYGTGSTRVWVSHTAACRVHCVTERVPVCSCPIEL